MDKKKFFLIGSLALATALVGSTFAAYAVTDGANPFNIKVSPGSIPSDELEGIVSLEWGDTKELANVENLGMNELAKVGSVGLKADSSTSTYTGKFSIKVTEETVRRTAPIATNEASLVDLLEFHLYEEKIELADVTTAVELKLKEENEDGVRVVSADIPVRNGDERVVTLFVKIATENPATYSQVSDKVCNLNINWGKADNDIEATRIYLDSDFAEPYIYAWDDNSQIAAWPGVKMNSADLDYYDLALNYNKVIFSDNGENQTIDLDLDINTRINTPVYSVSENKWVALNQDVENPEYYLVGTFNEWVAKEEYKLAENTENKGEYYISDVHIPANSKLKIQNPALGNDGYYAFTDNKDEFTIGEEGNYDFYFNPKGNKDWGNSYIWCQKHQSGETTSEESSSTTGGESSSESQTLPEFNGYYLVGTFNNWIAKDEYKLVENTENKGEYYILDVHIPANSKLKVQDPSLGDDGYYAFTNNKDEFTIGEEGNYDFYFNPKGNTDWKNSYIFCKPHQNDQGSSGEVSNPTSGGENSSSEESSNVVANGYYLVGLFSNWKPNDAYLFTLNESADEGIEEYMLKDVEIKATGDKDDFQFKVYNNETSIWYPNGDNLTVGKAGTYDFYFRPAGNTGWENYYVYVAAHE